MDRDDLVPKPCVANAVPYGSFPTSHSFVQCDQLNGKQAWCLYTSHFLSMWISRSYEYGAILFIQSAFPGTLLPSSIYGITETICVFFLAPSLGHWIDQADNRLRPLLITIIANRVTLIASCVVWLLLFAVLGSTFSHILFAFILALSMVEKVARMANMLSMERDWLPLLANLPAVDTVAAPYDLTHLNTVMRRIDFVCKFLAPLAISTYIASVKNSAAAGSIGVIAALSTGVELWCVILVWRHSPRLRKKQLPADGPEDTEYGSSSSPTSGAVLEPLRPIQRISIHLASHKAGVKYFFSTKVWLPSLCVAIMHASVLAWSGTLITWLLNSGYPLSQVTVAKGLGSIFELSSTFFYPWAVYIMSMYAPKAQEGYQKLRQQDLNDIEPAQEDVGTEPTDEIVPDTFSEHIVIIIKIARCAILGLSVAVIPAIVAVFLMSSSSSAPAPFSTGVRTILTPTAIIFVTFLSLSLLGRWTYDICATQLEQVLIPASHRASFGGTEQAIVSGVSLIHWIAAAVWHEQNDFKWLALGSGCVVVSAGIGFGIWTKSRI